MKNLLDKLWFRSFLIIVASVYITELGSVDSYSERIGTKDFYKEYAATAIISFTIFELVYYINKRLNKRIPWKDQVIHRLLVQLIIGWIAPVALVFGMASLYFLLYGVNIMKTDYLYYAFPFVVFMVLFINFIFVMTPFFLAGVSTDDNKSVEVNALQVKVTEQAIQIEQMEQMVQAEMFPPPVTLVKVQYGYIVTMLETTKIAAAYIVNKRMVVRHINDKEYMTDLTLDELENNYLPSQDFYRINRQLIASRAYCKEYKPIERNRVQVFLSIAVPVDTIVSNMKGKSFIDWIENKKYAHKKAISDK